MQRNRYKIVGFCQFRSFFGFVTNQFLFPSTETAQVAAAPVVMRHMITTRNVQHPSPHTLAVSEGQKAPLPVIFGASGDGDGSKISFRVSESRIFFARVDSIEIYREIVWVFFFQFLLPSGNLT